MSLTPVLDEVVASDADEALDTPWVTLVWNDPVNLHELCDLGLPGAYFGYSREKAEKLMMDVHVKGRAAVGPRCQGDHGGAHTEALHGYGLWATFQKEG